MPSEPSVAGVREGDILAGKYRIDAILGVGGMGVVVAAHHIHLDEKVAIKFLLPETLGNQEAVARFAREARAAVKIKSEHVARVSDVGTLENGAPYMVMEHLAGGDLSSWLEQRGPLPIDQAVEFVLQACEAIAEAHVLGIVHRDLKPANLFVIRGPDGLFSVKVLDFGISKASGLGGSGPELGMTKTSSVMGSPLYMSPEQMQSAKDVDLRGDIWALGVILYELVTGSTPFLGESFPELILKIMSSPPESLRGKRPDAPERFERAVFRCFEKDRNKRYQSVGELATALVEFGPKRSRASLDRISGVMQSARLARGGPDSGAGPESAWGHSSSSTVTSLGTSSATGGGSPAKSVGTVAPWGQTLSGIPRRRWAPFAFVGVVVALGAAAALYVKTSAVAPSPEPSTGSSAGAGSATARAEPSSNAAVRTLPSTPTVAPALPQVPEAPARPAPEVSPEPAPAGARIPAPTPPTVKPASLGRGRGTHAKEPASVQAKPGAAPPPAPPAVKPASPAENVFDDRK